MKARGKGWRHLVVGFLRLFLVHLTEKFAIASFYWDIMSRVGTIFDVLSESFGVYIAPDFLNAKLTFNMSHCSVRYETNTIVGCRKKKKAWNV